MKISIWRAYILKEIAKISFLFLFCFYALYILIDYAHHASVFRHQNQSAWSLVWLYYACEFSLRGEMLVPIALLLSSLKTLCKIKRDNELIAMQSAGISLKTLLSPFIVVGVFATLILYLNSEFLVPLAAKELQYIDDLHQAKKNSKDHSFIQKLFLEDGSQLIFHKYDSARELFIDVYWIRSADEIVKMETLDTKKHLAEAKQINFLKRNAEGELYVYKKEAKGFLPALRLDNKKAMETISQAESWALSKLWKKMPLDFKVGSEKEAKIMAAFFRKLAFPWICLLAIIAVIPACIGFSRQFAPFLIYMVALFALIAFYIFIDAVHILAKRQLVDPKIAFFAPMALGLLFTGGRYYKCT